MKIIVDEFDAKETEEAHQIFAERLRNLRQGPGSRFELGGIKYTLVGKFTAGIEGEKYRIINNDTLEEFVLKVYYCYREVMGDFFIKEKSCKSAHLMNVPVIVNIHLRYSISPLGKPASPNEEEISEFRSKITPLLDRDRLCLSDYQSGNFVKSEDNHLLRIDFGSACQPNVLTHLIGDRANILFELKSEKLREYVKNNFFDNPDNEVSSQKQFDLKEIKDAFIPDAIRALKV